MAAIAQPILLTKNMTTALKTKAIALTTTTTTAILTAGVGETIDISHIIASVSADGGTITAGVTDTSDSVSSLFWNGVTAVKNSPLDQVDLRLEAGDILTAGHTGATEASLLVVYSVRT